MTGIDRFAPAAAVADAVVFEGYVLYPYRASSTKNHCRWQFGVLAPPAYVARDPSERSTAQVDCIAVVDGAQPRVEARLRFLHAQRRTPRAMDEAGIEHDVDALETDTGTVVAWDEAVEARVDVAPLTVPPSGDASVTAPVRLEAAVEREEVGGRGCIVRSRAPITGQLAVSTMWADDARRLLRITATIANTTARTESWSTRDDMTRDALIAVHVMLAIDGGSFVSVMDPPASTRDAVMSCHQEALYPVLVGERDDVMLASPIILYDHPAVAPESPGDLYDATEIDEILALRVLTLTPDEKAQARALDPRAAAIVDRCDSFGPDTWSSLHGTIRSTTPADPGDDVVVVDGVAVRTGSPVTLAPSRTADAHDLFLAGRAATVEGVFRDVNGVDQLVAVSVDDDPARELLLWHGRYLYFHPDEIVPRSAR